jgi:predicted dehydrogenase
MLPQGFVPRKAGVLEAAPELGIGMLGYGFMGKAHTNAYKKIPYMFWPPTVRTRLVAMYGRTEDRVAEAVNRYGYEGYYTSWEQMMEDPRIDVFDNCGPDAAHCEPSIAAAQAGKHVLCEKPLGLNSEETGRMLKAVREAGVKHMCGFNYRFLPAVRLAKDIIDQGLLGRILHFRGKYLQEGGHRSERLAAHPGGRGVLLGLGSHVIDMARFLVGEIIAVMGMLPDMRAVTLAEFANGAHGTLEASNLCAGSKNRHAWEIHGTKGSLAWDLEDLNRLHVYLEDDSPRELWGFRNVLVTESYHPNISWKQLDQVESVLPSGRVWWPHGHILGWEHGHINEIFHFIDAVANGRPIAPYGATFEDGHRVAVISDAIERSFEEGKRVEVPEEIQQAEG